MSTGIWSAASGAVVQSYSLDIHANNVANATTPGFRSDRAVFRQELARATGSIGSNSMRYAVVRSSAPNLIAGSTSQTGRSLDVSLRDPDALFVVSTPKGERYTRAGSLQMSLDGTIVTREGHPYLGPDRKPIKVDPNAAAVGVAKDGSLVVDGVPGQRLLTVKFPEGALDKDSDVLLQARPGGPAPALVPADVEPETLELSNASAVSSMTGIVTASRQFEMLTRVIDAFSNIDRKAATDLMARR
ncbi:MAG: flagellar hook basal-body protein [Polyangiaceae bacterium]